MTEFGFRGEDNDSMSDDSMSENLGCCSSKTSVPEHIGRRERPTTTFARRKQLLAFSQALADFIVDGGIQPHELCLVRKFTEGLLLRD